MKIISFQALIPEYVGNQPLGFSILKPLMAHAEFQMK